MKVALMVAEKPSLAQSLANILSNGSCNSRKGFNGACSVHEWVGSFQGDSSVKFKMTSVCGHVLGVDFVGVYNSWDRVDPSELFTCPIEKKEATPKLQMPKFLQQEGKGCDYLILWLDCDKEGENICFEVINAVKLGMKPSYSANEKTIFRAKFSAITDKDIKAAMKNLVDPNENEALSVDARQELDLRIGCAFTRFQTKFFQGKYGNLDSSLISYGPCQTPTLGFCVERHDFIQSFKPETYWIIQSQAKDKEENNINLSWDRVRVFDRDIAYAFYNLVKDEKQATVLEVTQKEKIKQKPLALNTVELMRVASSGLGMSPHHAMQIAERLYTQGYISYPRTETTHYPENFDLKGALKLHTQSSDWGEYVRQLLSESIKKPRKGHDAGDHPPITPLKCASSNTMDNDSWRIYDYITRHFIGTVSPDCRYLQTEITCQINTEKFSCSGRTPLEDGYTTIMPWQAIPVEEKLPNCKIGDVFTVCEVKVIEKQTSPPDHLSESELITLMEKHGIGTDASIPVHINNICLRNYVNVTGSGRRLIPTTLGVILVHGYQKIDPDLVLPTMRAAVEQQLNLIAAGLADFSAVLKHAANIFQQKFQYFVKNITGMDELFEASFSSLSDSGRPMSRCGKCRRYMKLVSSVPVRLHCPACEDTYSLPQNGNIRLYKEIKCPLDDFELLQWYGGVKGKTYAFCPYCYNNPPFRDMKKGMGCNSCTHHNCSNALAANGVSNCFICDDGVLVLDSATAPKWKLACNRCDMIVTLFEDAQKLKVETETCESCGSQLMTVEYKIEKTKLPDGKSEATGCIFCENKLSSLVAKHHAINVNPNKMSRRGGRGRGSRGRGDRGRDKPRGNPKDKMAQLAAYFV